MDIYVINLDRHADRWRHASAALAGVDAHVVRVRAFDGQRLRERPFPAKPRAGALPALGMVLTRFEIACVLSHRRAWRKFLASGAGRCVVVEDDIHLGANVSAFLNDPALLSTGLDLVKLEAHRDWVVLDRKLAAIVQGREIRRLLTYMPGAGAYLLTRSAAERLLPLTRGAPDMADQLIFNAPKYRPLGFAHFRIGQVRPAPFIQDILLPQAEQSAALETYIGERRGERRRERSFSLAKIRRELLRPLRDFWFRRRAVHVEFE